MISVSVKQGSKAIAVTLKPRNKLILRVWKGVWQMILHIYMLIALQLAWDAMCERETRFWSHCLHLKIKKQRLRLRGSKVFGKVNNTCTCSIILSSYYNRSQGRNIALTAPRNWRQSLKPPNLVQKLQKSSTSNLPPFDRAATAGLPPSFSRALLASLLRNLAPSCAVLPQ